jgi:hypothetical protein
MTRLLGKRSCHTPDRFRITSQMAGKSMPSRSSSFPESPSSTVLRGIRQM